MSSSPPAPGMEDMEVEVEAETAHGEAPRPLPAAETGTGVVDGSAAANHTETSPSTHDHEEGGVDYSSNAGGTQRAEVEAAVQALWREVVNLEEKPSAGNTCSVCMEPWTCQGLHRICCIPCGHVYGRSCLEKWLHENAKCPQCKLHFEEKLIINLYTPANFGDGCGTIQEVKVYVSKAMAEVAAHYERQLDSEIARFEAAGAQYARQLESEFARFKAEQRLFHQAAHEQLASTARILDEMDQMQAQIEALQAELLVEEQPSCQAVAASSEASRVVEGRGTGSAEPGEEDHQSQ